MRRLVFSAIISLILLSLVGCSNQTGSGALPVVDIPTQNLPRGPRLMTSPEHDGTTAHADDIPGFETQLIELPLGFMPLGFLSETVCLFMDSDARQVLWLYDFTSDSLHEIVDYRHTEYTLGPKIAFNERWLAWTEIEPYRTTIGGSLSREVRLMAAAWEPADLATSESEASIPFLSSDVFIVDVGSNSPAEGFYLPFDSLDLDGDSLVFRQSIFDAGWRDTRVKLAQLASGTVQTLGAASGISGRQILSCSIDKQLVAWDVQINFQRVPTATVTQALSGALDNPDDYIVTYIPYPQLPMLPDAVYTIHTWQLDSSKLPFGTSPERIITQNDVYYAPFVTNDTLMVLQHVPQSRSWTDRPVGPSGSDLWLNYRTYDTLITLIRPEFNSARVLVGAFEYSRTMMDHYASLRSPRAIQRDSIHVGKRLLSWRSNVGDRHIAFDLETQTFVELPVYFSNVYDDVIEYGRVVRTRSEVGAMLMVEEVVNFPYFPHMLNVRVTAITGLDADYLYFEYIDSDEPPYILRIS